MQVLLLMIPLLLSCGNDALSLRSPSAYGSFGSETRPPADYYRALLTARFNARPEARQNISPAKVFLHFGGAEVVRGFASDESFLPCNERAIVSPTALSIAAQEDVYDELAAFFRSEDVELDLVLDEPFSGDYSTLHVGGRYYALGCRGQEVLGAVPSDHGDVNPADIGFVFDRGHEEQDLLTRAIAHAIGRMVGLPVHNREDTTIMGRQLRASTPLVLSEQERQIFRARHADIFDHLLGDELPGEIFVNAVSTVLAEVDYDEVLDITPLQQQLRVIVPDAVQLPDLDRALTAVADLGLEAGDFRRNNSWRKIKRVFTSVLRKSVRKSIDQPSDLKGNVVSSIDDVFGDKLKDSKHTQRLTKLPDLSALLGLDTLANAQLFPLLTAHRQLLARTLDRQERDSMESLLKVGYFQRLHGIP